MEEKFVLTPTELVTFHKCLSSKICRRIFKTLITYRKLNISAISRKVGCTNRDGIRHLRNLAELNIVEEEFHHGLHTFTLKKEAFTRLMEQAIKIIEDEQKTEHQPSKSEK